MVVSVYWGGLTVE